ncbi:MAG: hypothetical protein ABL958_07455 [Bdellovibrionia bacterium]
MRSIIQILILASVLSACAGGLKALPGASTKNNGPLDQTEDPNRNSNPTPTPYPGVAGCNGGKLTDMKAYFFQLIGRREGDLANDWQTVLDRSGIPAGPTDGVKLPIDAPFYGLSQQRNSANEVRGRLFLPTDVPDGWNYYTHPIDVLTGDPLRWTWNDWIGGPAYVPRSCP